MFRKRRSREGVSEVTKGPEAGGDYFLRKGLLKEGWGFRTDVLIGKGTWRRQRLRV